MLEKILEEIDDIYVDDIGCGVECNLEERTNLPCDNCYECIKEACKNIIRKHMNDGWISVEERLPERTLDEKINNSYKKYLVFIDNIDYWDIDIAVYDLWNDKKWREFSNTYCEIENVTAWCPLPDPYKKIQEENK